MLRHNSSPSDSERNERSQSNQSSSPQSREFDVQRELERLEEIILDSFHIPLTQRTLVNERELLDQLDAVRTNLPDAFEEASAVIRQKEEIIQQAEAYAQDTVKTAQQHAAQIKDETGIVQQAEREAHQVREGVQQECEELRRTTFSEVEQTRYSTKQELEQMRQQTLAECEEIQDGADDYAETVLTQIEQQLSDMLEVIYNGRKSLQRNAQSQRYQKKNAPASGSSPPSGSQRKK